MPDINQIVKVTLTRQSSAIPQSGFGTILVLSFDTAPVGITGDVNSYSSTSYQDAFADGGVRNVLDAYFSQSVTPQRAYVGFRLVGDTDVSDALDRVSNANNDFYGVIPVGATLTAGDKIKVGEWAEANGKVCFIDDASAEILDGTSAADSASLAKAGSLKRTAVFYNAEADESVAGAVAGRLFPTLAGSSVAAYKALSSVTAAGLSDTQITVLDNKNANYFDALGGQNILFKGVMSDGGFIDLVRDSDWIVSRIQEGALFQLVNNAKIPYTEDGANILVRSVQDVIDQAVLQGVLDAEYTIARSSIDSIPVNDRSNRSFPSINVVGRYAGAIQLVNFDLTISV